tara:strand:+ start:408 stop:1025 length:618 start_codon:yes stop_codon:yes gene_type:complete
MAKSKSSLPTQAELKIQGKSLASLDAKEMKALKAKTTKVVHDKDSLDYQLGQLQVNILKLENVKIISKELAKKYGIASIEARRRNESKILFLKYDEVISWLKSTRKRYTSLSALLKAFAKANKPKTEDKPKASDETKSQDEPKVQDSDSSETKEEPKVQKKLTASDVALEALLLLEIHGISIQDFTREFNSQYKELVSSPKEDVA